MAIVNTKTAKDFKSEVIESQGVVLVDFWAEWCPPCHAMAPVLEKVASKEDRKVVKVDVDASEDNNNLARKYEVSSIPNMVLFKNGKVVERFIGVIPESVILEAYKKHS